MGKKKSGRQIQSPDANNGATPETQGSSKKNKTTLNGDSNNPKQNKRQSIMDSDSQVKVKKTKVDNSESLQIHEESSPNQENSSNKKKKKQKPQIVDNAEESVETSEIKVKSSKIKKKKSTGLKPSSTSLITNGEKLSKKQKKRAAVQLHKIRVNEIKEKLSKGTDVGYIVRQLQAIIEEKQKISDLKISISCAKKLIYFHKHGKDPISKKHKNKLLNKNDDEIEADSDDADNVEVKIKPKDKKKLNIVENLKNQKGQSRYVLFVGNIPYDATTDELKDIFSKIGDVKDVRLPLEKESNNPRGFGYVELSDEASYQRGLSLHHTMMRDRRINVLYTQGGKKKGEDQQHNVIRKNLKLHAMRKKGILTGTLKDSKKKNVVRKKSQPQDQSK